MDVGEHREFVSLAVEPFSGPAGEPLFLVAFREVGFVPQDAAAERGVSDQGGAVEALNEELLVAQERLRDLTEELEAAKEEYLSVNEELNAANEELETSREELQSLNEELQTINAELSNRNESLVRSNSDLVNLLDSTPIAILFLDGDMRIRRFTPRLLDIFKVREGDEGRPISDIVTRLGSNGLEEDVQQVLRTQAPIAREVTLTDSDTSYVMQIRPYRDLNNVLDGVIITFIDISERKRIEEVRSRIAAIVDSSQDAIISTDLDGIITSWNMGAEQLYGYPAAEAAGKPLSILLAAPALDDWPEVLEKLRQGERIAQFDSIRVAQGGLSIDVAITISPVKGAEERITGASVVARDITHRREAELKTALLLGELDHRVKNILAIVSAVVSQTLKATPSPEVFAVEVEGRIQAIAKAHSLLTQTGRGEMSLRILVETELAPYDREGRNLSIKGGDVALTPKAGMALALAIHELASNAAKYGALSTPAGHLAVEWTIAEDEMLTLIWAEAGGPHVRPPSRRGFGTTLIERALTAELDAEVNRQFLASGLLCTIRLALTDEIGRPRASR
nr:PAS domain-containing protein [Neoroseomonas terrae]